MSDYSPQKVVHTPDGVAYGDAALPEAELLRLLKDPESLLWRHLDRPVKISHECLLVEAELPLAGATVQVAYKQFRPRSWWKSLCGRFRRSPARRGWELGRALLARGIATPRPLAACVPRGRWLSAASYLATAWIAAGENLHLFAWRLAELPASQRLRLASRCAVRLGQLLGRMHAQGVVHRDLKAANLLAAEDRDDVAVWLLDLDGVRILRRPGTRRRRRLGAPGRRTPRPSLADAQHRLPIPAGIHRRVSAPRRRRLEGSLARGRPPRPPPRAAPAALRAAGAVSRHATGQAARNDSSSAFWQTIVPFCSRRVRLARAAARGSCVTMTMVLPSALNSSRKAMICWLVSGSRLPVGSSARMTAGSLASIRARATRCCWPTLSSPGLWSRRSASPTRSNKAVARSFWAASPILARKSGTWTFSRADR